MSETKHKALLPPGPDATQEDRNAYYASPAFADAFTKAFGVGTQRAVEHLRAAGVEPAGIGESGCVARSEHSSDVARAES